MTFYRSSSVRTCLTALVIAMPGLAQAQSSTEIGLYGFLTAIEGTQRLGPLESDVDLSFSEIVENLDMAAMAFIHHRIDRWSLFGDIFYADLGSESEAGNVDIDVGFKQTILGLYAGYNVYQNPVNNGIIDLTAGFRYNRLDVSIDTDGTGPNGTEVDASRSGDRDWTDVVVGVRASQDLGNGWGISGWADFGVGVDKDSTSYQLTVTGNYTFDNNVKLYGGYRYYNVDLKDGNFEMDTATSGPVIGVSYTF